MQNASTWFEIPVTDLDKSQRFYEAALGRPMRREALGGDSMAIFAHDDAGTGGCIVHRPDCQANNANTGGTIIYLDCAPSVDAALTRLQAAGGRIVVGKTLIAPGIGYFAQMQDLDGNLVGLHATD